MHIGTSNFKNMKNLFITITLILSPLFLMAQTLLIRDSKVVVFQGSMIVAPILDTIACDSVMQCDQILDCDQYFSYIDAFILNFPQRDTDKYFRHEEILTYKYLIT